MESSPILQDTACDATRGSEPADLVPVLVVEPVSARGVVARENAEIRRAHTSPGAEAISCGNQTIHLFAEHVYRIRRELDPDRRQCWIETSHGVGHRFVPPTD